MAEKVPGTDPLEEVGPSECAPSPAECEQTVAEMDEGQSDFSWREELDDAFKPAPIPMVAHPQDGLPTPANESRQLQIAPAFSRLNIVCVEDDTAYVELFAEELLGRWVATATVRGDARLLPHADAAKHGGDIRQRSKYDDEGQPRDRQTFKPEQVQKRYGHSFAMLERAWIPVRPVRERCKHFRRQLFVADPNKPEGEFGKLDLYTNCMVRRSVGGAFMSLKDEAIRACEYRDPPDPGTTTEYLDEPMRRKLETEPEQAPLFNRS